MSRSDSDVTGWDLLADGTVSPCDPYPWDRPAPTPALRARGIHSASGTCAMILSLHGEGCLDSVVSHLRERWPDACIMHGLDIVSPAPAPFPLTRAPVEA